MTALRKAFRVVKRGRLDFVRTGRWEIICVLMIGTDRETKSMMKLLGLIRFCESEMAAPSSAYSMSGMSGMSGMSSSPP